MSSYNKLKTMLGAARFIAFLAAQPLKEMSASTATASASRSHTSSTPQASQAIGEEAVDEVVDVVVFQLKDFTDALVVQCSRV
jgi:hypothetical protein